LHVAHSTRFTPKDDDVLDTSVVSASSAICLEATTETPAPAPSRVKSALAPCGR